MHPNSPVGRQLRLHWFTATTAAAAAIVVTAAPANARVTRIAIDSVAPLAGQSIP